MTAAVAVREVPGTVSIDCEGVRLSCRIMTVIQAISFGSVPHPTVEVAFARPSGTPSENPMVHAILVKHSSTIVCNEREEPE
jgi:hypothetical protein